MTRLKRELRKRGLIFEAPDYPWSAEYDACQALVTITETVIVTVFDCSVLPTELRLYDRRTFAEIGGQNLTPEPMLFGKGKSWDSYAVE